MISSNQKKREKESNLRNTHKLKFKIIENKQLSKADQKKNMDIYIYI